jgi:hypothetical protein
MKSEPAAAGKHDSAYFNKPPRCKQRDPRLTGRQEFVLMILMHLQLLKSYSH